VNSLKFFQCKTQYQWVEDKSTIEELIAFYLEHHNIDYDAIHVAFCKRYQASHLLLANWKPEDFEGAISNARFHARLDEDTLDWDNSSAVENVDAQAATDKMMLQNYGRPYDANGKPSGTYYGFAKKTVMPFFK
jgi:hypothetical protein